MCVCMCVCVVCMYVCMYVCVCGMYVCVIGNTRIIWPKIIADMNMDYSVSNRTEPPFFSLLQNTMVCVQ